LQLETMLISLWNDLRFAWCMLRKSPGFTLTAIITLALGIGGNTAVFTVMNAVLLRGLPYQDPRQLVLINAHHRGDAADDGGTFTLNRYELLRDHNRSFSGVAVAVLDSFNLTGRGDPQQVPVARVSPNFFAVLGLHPQLGRSFKLMMSLLAVFSSIALVLVIVGIYGVIAYSVAQRKRELGIRLALGAEKSDILQLVVRQGVTLAVIGTVIGLAVAVPLTRFISSLLYKVGVWDFATFALSPLLFLLIALFASYLPARRATQVDPTEALRQG
jgi:hypothetical protein